ASSRSCGTWGPLVAACRVVAVRLAAAASQVPRGAGIGRARTRRDRPSLALGVSLLLASLELFEEPVEPCHARPMLAGIVVRGDSWHGPHPRRWFAVGSNGHFFAAHPCSGPRAAT